MVNYGNGLEKMHQCFKGDDNMEEIPRCCKKCIWIDDCRTLDSYEWERLLQDNPEMISCHRTYDYEDTDGATPKENAIQILFLINGIKIAITERDLAIENYWEGKPEKYSRSFGKHYTEFGIEISSHGGKSSTPIDSLEYILKQLFYRR